MDVGSLFFHFSEFLNYCHYVSHDKMTIGYMQTSLKEFKILVERHFFAHHNSQMKTPKYHMLEHYCWFILQFGSLLNGDTDTTESLHTIVKQAYKNSNKKGSHKTHYLIAQLILIAQ